MRPHLCQIPGEMRRNRLSSARQRRKLSPSSNFQPEEEEEVEEDEDEEEPPGRKRMQEEEERRVDRLLWEKEAAYFGWRMNRVWEEAKEDFHSRD